MIDDDDDAVYTLGKVSILNEKYKTDLCFSINIYSAFMAWKFYKSL